MQTSSSSIAYLSLGWARIDLREDHQYRGCFGWTLHTKVSVAFLGQNCTTVALFYPNVTQCRPTGTICKMGRKEKKWECRGTLGVGRVLEDRTRESFHLWSITAARLRHHKSNVFCQAGHILSAALDTMANIPHIWSDPRIIPAQREIHIGPFVWETSKITAREIKKGRQRRRQGNKSRKTVNIRQPCMARASRRNHINNCDILWSLFLGKALFANH